MSVLVTDFIVPKSEGGAIALDTVHTVAPTTVNGAATKSYTDGLLTDQFERLEPFATHSGFSTFLLSGGASNEGVGNDFAVEYCCADHVATITWSGVTLTPNAVTPSPTTSTSRYVVPDGYRRAAAVHKSHVVTNGGLAETGRVRVNPDGTLTIEALANWAGACSVPAGSITYIY